MKMSEQNTKEMVRLFQELEHTAQRAVKTEAEDFTIVGKAAMIVAQLKSLEIQRECNARQEHALQMVLGRDNGDGMQFCMRDDAMDCTRTAEVYPNAHNGGATFGLSINTQTKHMTTQWPGGRFCGPGWSKDVACEAARLWVQKGVLPQGA